MFVLVYRHYLHLRHKKQLEDTKLQMKVEVDKYFLDLNLPNILVDRLKKKENGSGEGKSKK